MLGRYCLKVEKGSGGMTNDKIRIHESMTKDEHAQQYWADPVHYRVTQRRLST